MDFAVLADHSVKIKESKNIDKHFDLAKELKQGEKKEKEKNTQPEDDREINNS